MLFGERLAADDKKPSARKKNRQGPFLLLLPAFIIILGITVYPVFYSLFLSLTNQEGTFIGLGNFISIFSDQAVYSILGKNITVFVNSDHF